MQRYFSAKFNIYGSIGWSAFQSRMSCI